MGPYLKLALLSLMLPLLLCSCMSLPLGDNPLGDNDSRNNPGPSLTQKRVVDKRGAQELVAQDGTRCVTTRERFDKTRVGDHVWCAWQ